MMRLFLFMSLFLSLLEAKEFWIQVASVKRADALTPMFMKKVDATALEKKIVVGETWCRVYLGKFEREIDALEVLPNIRCSVAPDAYIVSDITAASNKLISAKKAPENMDINVTTMEQMPVAIATDSKAQEPMGVVKETKVTQKVHDKAFGIENGHLCECICDAREFKKAKMREALRFYKNSQTYHFSYREKKRF